MMITQTLQDFLNNPMGKGSTAIAGRQLVYSDLVKRYEKLKSKIKIKKFYKGKKGVYFVHLLIPSEDLDRKNTYDVVLEFFPDSDGNAPVSNLTILKHHVRFFSNNPAFVYTYTHTFLANGLLVLDLANKYREEVIEHPPVTRNPGLVVNYDKSIVFASLYLMDHKHLLTYAYIHSVAAEYDASKLNDTIRHMDKIIIEIKKEKARVEREKEDNSRKRPSAGKIKASSNTRVKPASQSVVGSRTIKGSKSTGSSVRPASQPMKKIKDDPTKMMNKGKIGGRRSSR